MGISVETRFSCVNEALSLRGIVKMLRYADLEGAVDDFLFY